MGTTSLSPAKAKSVMESVKLDGSIGDEQKLHRACEKFVHENCRDLIGLPDERYGLPPPNRGNYYPWYLVLEGLGPRYIPEHQAMLNAVHRLMAD